MFVRDEDAAPGLGEGLFRYEEEHTPAFPHVGSYFPYRAGFPCTLFSDVESSSSSDGSSLYNSFHQPLVDMLLMRDKIITAQMQLTAEDVRSINFRQLIKIEDNLYILNKIKDFNFSGEPTEVELILVTRTGTNYEIQ